MSYDEHEDCDRRIAKLEDENRKLQLIELFGTISTVLAVIGVLANNRRLRWCFLVWMVSNALSMVIHSRARIWSLTARDAIFLVLAIEGWIMWGNDGS